MSLKLLRTISFLAADYKKRYRGGYTEERICSKLYKF